MRRGLSMLFWLFNLAAQAQGGTQEGKLTLSITHEIQSPYYFVNNFSDVHKALVTGPKRELLCDEYNEINVCLCDPKQNKKKLAYHGMRAENIVESLVVNSTGSVWKSNPQASIIIIPMT